MGLEAA